MTVGVVIPTVMMVNGAARLDITYHWWAWAGIPAIWAPAVLAAVLLRAAPGPWSAVLFLSSVFGGAFFWSEFGLYTFGPVCLRWSTPYTCGRCLHLVGEPNCRHRRQSDILITWPTSMKTQTVERERTAER